MKNLGEPLKKFVLKKYFELFPSLEKIDSLYIELLYSLQSSFPNYNYF